MGKKIGLSGIGLLAGLSVIRCCRAALFVIAAATATATANPATNAVAGCTTAIYIPGWCRNGGDSAQELALLAKAFPGARCEVRTWDGDGLDFWACRDEADAEGHRFGTALAALPEEEREGFALVGHSLGARVIVRALAVLAAEGKAVRRAALLGAAIPEDDPELAAAARGCAGELVCVSSQGDIVLKWFYGSGGEGLEQALGLNGWPTPTPTNVVQRFLPPSFTEGFVPDALLMDFAAMRRLCLHYAPFYLRYLADLEGRAPAPPDDPDIVRQGLPNLRFPTIDKEVWWVVEDSLEPGWKLERNIVFGQWRILNPRGWRYAWGTQPAMRRAFGELKIRHAEKADLDAPVGVGERSEPEGVTHTESPAGME